MRFAAINVRSTFKPKKLFVKPPSGISNNSYIKKVLNFLQFSSIDIYPVANTGNTIFFRGLTETRNMTLSVRDAAGSSVFSTILINANSVELPSLKSGLYIISLNNSLTNERTNLRYIKM